MRARNVEPAMYLEEQVAKEAGLFARTYDPGRHIAGVPLVVKEQLDFCMHRNAKGCFLA